MTGIASTSPPADMAPGLLAAPAFAAEDAAATRPADIVQHAPPTNVMASPFNSTPQTTSPLSRDPFVGGRYDAVFLLQAASNTTPRQQVLLLVHTSHKQPSMLVAAVFVAQMMSAKRFWFVLSMLHSVLCYASAYCVFTPSQLMQRVICTDMQQHPVAVAVK